MAELTWGELMKHLESAGKEIRAEERERCAKIADNYAASCKRGSSMSSMAEDAWGYVHATEIAKLVRKANPES